MKAGSHRARVLKLADRISNLTALGFVTIGRSSKYLDETTVCNLPHAEQVNPDMFREL
jgi:GTP pyrophosphokinase